MIHGTIAGVLICDLIINKKNRWSKAYDPKRSMFKNCSQLIKHNVMVVGSFLDYLTPGDTASIKSIPNGEGKILRKGLNKIAVFRDENGELCKKKAICTHMQAPLVWNPIEKTWDCPAHGSRFAPCGKVLQGPAKDPLNNV